MLKIETELSNKDCTSYEKKQCENIDYWIHDPLALATENPLNIEVGTKAAKLRNFECKAGNTVANQRIHWQPVLYWISPRQQVLCLHKMIYQDGLKDMC